MSRTAKLVHVSSPSAALEAAIAKWLGDCIYLQNELLDEELLIDDCCAV